MIDPADGAKPLHAYLDTNALLEFRGLRDNDWNDLFKANHVILVIVPVVLDELQRIKDGGGRDLPRRKRRRAGELLNSLEQELFPDAANAAGPIQLKKGVELAFDDKATPAEVFTKYSLDPNLADTRLVAAVIAARDNGLRVCLAGNDAGPRWQAKSRQIPAFNLPEDWRHAEEPDENEIEIRSLKKKLAAHESRAPDLSLSSKTGQSVLRFELPEPRLPVDDYVARHMEALRGIYGHYGEDLHATIGLGMLGNLFGPPAEAEIERYNRQMDDFLSKAERLLPKVIAHRNDLDLYLPLELLALSNTGNQPAEKVRVILRAPAEIEFRDDCPINSGPELPSPPERPRSFKDSILAARDALRAPDPATYLFRRRPLQQIAPSWQIAGREATFSAGTVRHKVDEALPKLFAKLPTYEAASSFQIEFELHAYNIPEPLAGKLHVLVTKGTRMTRLRLGKWEDADESLAPETEDDMADNG